MTNKLPCMACYKTDKPRAFGAKHPETTGIKHCSLRGHLLPLSGLRPPFPYTGNCARWLHKSVRQEEGVSLPLIAQTYFGRSAPPPRRVAARPVAGVLFLVRWWNSGKEEKGKLSKSGRNAGNGKRSATANIVFCWPSRRRRWVKCGKGGGQRLYVVHGLLHTLPKASSTAKDPLHYVKSEKEMPWKPLQVKSDPQNFGHDPQKGQSIPQKILDICGSMDNHATFEPQKRGKKCRKSQQEKGRI